MSRCRRRGWPRHASSKATVQLWSEPGRNFAARLRELSPQADAATRTYAARFTIDNPDDSVALGMTATVTLSHAADVPVAKLPLAAILNRGTGPSVYVVDASGALELRPVTVASFTEDAALVTSGVERRRPRSSTLGVQKLDAGERSAPSMSTKVDDRGSLRERAARRRTGS